MIFVDSNVPMYLVGQDHPNRDRLEHFFRSNADETFVTSAEVYQEVVHRYVAIDRREAVLDCFELLDAIVDRIYPIEVEQVRRAREVAEAQPRLSGRDCLHISTMESHGVERVLTLDSGFDYWPGLERLP